MEKYLYFIGGKISNNKKHIFYTQQKYFSKNEGKKKKDILLKTKAEQIYYQKTTLPETGKEVFSN